MYVYTKGACNNNKLKQYFTFFYLAFVLFSCGPTYKKIVITEDNTATITSLSNPIFQEGDTITPEFFGEVIDSITDLDSLGSFIQVGNKDVYSFEYNKEYFKLEILDSGLVKRTPLYRSVPDYLFWEFPDKIIGISGIGEVHLHRNSKIFRIDKSESNYIDSNNALHIIALFGDNSIKSRIKHPFSLRRAGASMENLPSFGFSHIHGTASEYIDGLLFMNWGLSIILNKFRVTPRLTILDSEIIKSIGQPPGLDHLKNQKVEFGLGYELINSTYLNFTPNVFLGKNKMYFYSSSESVKSQTLYSGVDYCIGATLELKINPVFRNNVKRNALKDEYFFLKVDAGWYPNYFRDVLTIKGSMSYLTFALGWYFVRNNNFRRVKLNSTNK